MIKGSALGPASFIITSSDFQPIHAGKAIVKFADDTDVIVPAANSDSTTSELIACTKLGRGKSSQVELLEVE